MTHYIFDRLQKAIISIPLEMTPIQSGKQFASIAINTACYYTQYLKKIAFPVNTRIND